MDALPKTINEAVTILLSEMSGRDKLIFLNTKREDLILSHLTLGEEIRNKFGLWSGNDALIKDATTTHPDSISMEIIETIWEELQKQSEP